ncbi:MAG TPA: MATE family efflux transporter [Bacillota bacterium]|nr:MATE family efflux transporter [Bacillota bacterium]
MAGNALQSLGATGSSILMGRLIGVDALAAISAFFPALFFLVSLIIGVGSASAVLIGQAYGADDPAQLKAVAGTSLTFTFLLGAVFGVTGSIFAPAILRILGTPAVILPQTIAFARVLLDTLPVLFLFDSFSTFFRGTGDSKTPTYFLAVSVVVNILVTAALTVGWLGLPRLGVAAAAWGMVIGAAVTFAAFLIFLHRRRHPLRFDRALAKSLGLNRRILGLLVKIGLPTGVQMVLISLSEIAVITFVNRFGASATAAYGAVNQIASYVQLPAISLGIAVSIFGAQAIGAGRSEGLRRIVRAGIGLNFAVGGTLVLAAYLGSGPLLHVFITDAPTAAVAHGLLMITLWSYLVFGTTVVLSGMMRSSGDVLWPTVLSIATIWGIEVPVAYVMSHRIGLTGVWLGYPAAFVIGLGLQSLYYLRVWRRKSFTRLLAS